MVHRIFKFVKKSMLFLSLMIFTIGLVGSSFAAQARSTDGAKSDSLRIVVNNGTTSKLLVEYKRSDLAKMPQSAQAYSAIDSMPAPVICAAKGVLLKDIVSASGIDLAQVDSFTFKANDGYSISLKKDFLFAARNYYPKISEKFSKDIFPTFQSGIEDGKKSVDVLVALNAYQSRFAKDADFSKADDSQTLRLFFGQVKPEETTNSCYVKYLNEIQINTYANSSSVSQVKITVPKATSINTDVVDKVTSKLGMFSYLQWGEDPKTTMRVTWNVAGASAPYTVQVLPVAQYNGSFAKAKVVSASLIATASGVQLASGAVTGLQPGTQYVFRTGSAAGWNTEQHFTTADNTDKCSFIYMGDVQQGYPQWGDFLQAAYRANPLVRFLIMGGDMVNEGADISQWQQFFGAGNSVLSALPIAPAAGNHDEGNTLMNLFPVISGQVSTYGAFYSFDNGNAHFLVLDSNVMGTGSVGYQEVRKWVATDLASSKKQWKFVVLHHPPYPAVSDAHAENLQQNWVPLFKKGGVDIVLTGHQHMYMRTRPIDGITYVMGNAGSKFYPCATPPDYATKCITDSSTYQLFTLNGKQCSLSVINAAGKQVDSLVIEKK